jgi:hypothetical protein
MSRVWITRSTPVPPPPMETWQMDKSARKLCLKILEPEAETVCRES